jgi:hypothetical protein
MINLTLKGKLLIEPLYYTKYGKDGLKKILVHVIFEEQNTSERHTPQIYFPIFPVYIVDPKIQTFIHENMGMDGCEVEIFGELKVKPSFVKSPPDRAETFLELNSSEHYIKLIEIERLKKLA